MPDRLRKAINDGLLREPKAVGPGTAGSNKSSRSALDAAAADGMGTACTRVLDRTLASIGQGDEAEVRFEPCLDVPKAGVLCALPALLSNGLLGGAQQLLGKIKGYYSVFQILLLVAFMALCRIKAVDRLQGIAPGELGKLLGLDRSPDDAALAENPYLSRFTLVFDREGYSPAFFGGMWRDHRIACITYRKYPDDDWPEEWFSEKTATTPGGETVTMRLAEMGSLIGSGKDAIWMREIRKLYGDNWRIKTSLIGFFRDENDSWTPSGWLRTVRKRPWRA